jgi:hypothetical protein
VRERERERERESEREKESEWERERERESLGESAGAPYSPALQASTNMRARSASKHMPVRA